MINGFLECKRQNHMKQTNKVYHGHDYAGFIIENRTKSTRSRMTKDGKNNRRATSVFKENPSRRPSTADTDS